jgi:hypothetical protein
MLIYYKVGPMGSGRSDNYMLYNCTDESKQEMFKVNLRPDPDTGVHQIVFMTE